MTNATGNLISDDFVLWMARFAEGAATEQSIRKRFRLDDATWERLSADDALVERIEEIRLQRVADGTAARERAQQLFAGAPNVLGEILHGQAPPRVKVETAKELRAIAANGPGEAATRFEITIDLGGDVVERYSKSIEINPHDVDPAQLEAKAKTDSKEQIWEEW
jgi:hypothetical protein